MNERLPAFLERIERDYYAPGLMLLLNEGEVRRLFETAKRYHEMVQALAEEKLSEAKDHP
jgi:hypothetical protein